MDEKKSDNKVVARIAKKIRATRLEKKLTIQQLATRTKVSKGLLSKIENSRTIPSLPVFVTLIESLDISLKEFFEDVAIFNGNGYLLVRSAEQSPIEDVANPGLTTSHLFTQQVPGRTMQTVVTSVAPGTSVTPFVGEGFVLHYIVNGTTEYIINHQHVTLEEGDAIYFEGSSAVVVSNPSNQKAKILATHYNLLR